MFLILFGAAIGPTFIGVALYTLVPLQKKYKPSFLVSLIVLLSVVVIGVVFSFTKLIDPFNKYLWYVSGDKPKLDVLNQFLGGVFVSIYIPVGIALVIMLTAYSNIYPRIVFSLNSQISLLQPNTKLSYNWMGLLAIALSFSTFFVLTTFLPNMWRNGLHDFVTPGGYFALNSPYSVVHNVTWFQGQPIINETSKLPDPNYVVPAIYFKLYQDVIVYYAAVVAVVVVGAFSTYYAPLRRVMHMRMSVDWIPKIVSLWPYGICIGEIFLVTVILGLEAYWFWYWSDGWKYRSKTVYNDGGEEIQKYARVMGEMAILTMSFLTVPVTKNNIWESVFGVPFDRAVRYHRTLGALAWVQITLHMVLFQILWIKNDTLANNAWMRTTNLIFGSIDGFTQIHSTNFTIPIMEFTWLLSSLALLAAALRTSLPYEIFQYTHYIMILLYIMSFVHAFQSWYFTGGGLLLYVCDKCLRWILSSKYIEASSLTYYSDANFTRISVPKSKFGREFVAGQYCWICVPSVSSTEWHPFSISSAPSSGVIEFSVLNLGYWSWTHKLGVLAKAKTSKGEVFMPRSPRLSQIPDPELEYIPEPLLIDGPYGRCMPYSGSKMAIFVAGGIGVTPIISMLSEIVSLKKAESQELQSVHFIWVARSPYLFASFGDLLDPIFAQSGKLNIKIYLYATLNRHERDSMLSAGDEKAADADEENVYNVYGDKDQGIVGQHPSKPPKVEMVKRTKVEKEESERLKLRQSNVSLQSSDSVQDKSLKIKYEYSVGRPSMEDAFLELAKVAASTPNADPTREGDVSVIACGPTSLMEEVSAECFKYNFDFQCEQFSV